MSYASRITEAPNVQTALLELARGLDEVLEKLKPRVELDPWNVGGWDPRGETEPRDGDRVLVTAGDIVRTVRVEQTEGETTIQQSGEVPERVKEQRRGFERQQLQIGKYLNDDSQDWTEAYAKGGPLWLYHSNRQLVIDMPRYTRQAMVTDLIDLGLTEEAHKMSGDILKEDCEVPDISTGERALGGAE